MDGDNCVFPPGFPEDIVANVEQKKLLSGTGAGKYN